MQDMKLSTTLPAVSFDYDGLMAWAKGIASKYDGLVVREEDVVGIKAEMADLNKAKKAVDDARKEAVKQVSAPIRNFEAQIKEVCAVFTETYDALKAQVRAHEDRERENKRIQVQFMIDNLKDEHGVPDIQIDVEPSWLNKSKTMKDVKGAIEGVILAQIKAEQDAAQLEQALRDRAAYIEEKCATLSKVHGFTLQPSQFIMFQSLDVPIGEVGRGIENAFATRAAQNAAATVPDPAPSISRATTPEPSRPPKQTRSVVVEVTYDADREQEVQVMLRNLQTISTVKIVAHAA